MLLTWELVAIVLAVVASSLTLSIFFAFFLRVMQFLHEIVRVVH
jgi:hypothetical protein